MIPTIQAWLGRMWLREQHPDLAEDYRVTFESLQGQRVLRHLVDSIYCSVYEGTDAVALATHNGRRSVVQEILENVDAVKHPEKYRYIEEREITHPVE